MHTAAIIKIFCLFAAIVLLYRLKIPLWLDVMLVSLATGLWFGAAPQKTLTTAGLTLISKEVLYLGAVVILIQGFGHALNGSGVLNRIVATVSALLGKSMYSAAALPAFIGLLPMPGGALFSAPMVQNACVGCDNITPEHMTAVNHWFRHIWEYWWPMYPGVILASQLFHMPIWLLMALHIPLTVGAATGGYIFILRPIFHNSPDPNGDTPRESGALKRAAAESAPILVTIVSIFAIAAILIIARVHGMEANYWPVIFGVLAGMTWLGFAKKIGPRQYFKYLIAKDQLSMLFTATAVMVFKDMLVAANAFEGIQRDMAAYHVPALIVIAALPFISGLVMGLTIGYVGGSFPLIISILPAAVMKSDVRFAYLALAYSFGYMGMLLSPVHLCLILTRNYFKADIAGVYKQLIPAAAFVFLTGASLFLLYLKLFG